VCVLYFWAFGVGGWSWREEALSSLLALNRPTEECAERGETAILVFACGIGIFFFLVCVLSCVINPVYYHVHYMCAVLYNVLQ